MNRYIAVHSFNNGENFYLFSTDQDVQDETFLDKLVKKFDIRFEEDREEFITINKMEDTDTFGTTI